MKKILSLICAILFTNSLVLAQQGFSLNGFQYIVIDNGSVAVWNCYNNQDTVIIPDIVMFDSVKYTVVAIAGGAFMGRDDIVSVIIPNTVTSIGQSAFQECENLSSVVMPNSITNIGSWAFTYCSNLTSFTIPNSVTSIGGFAFTYCSSLTSVTIPDSVTHIGAAIFGSCTNLTTLDYNAKNCNGFSAGTDHPFSYSSISTINIGDNVEKIPENFLYDMDSITTINFSNNITHIGKKAFAYYDGFTTLNLPDSITHIGEEAFLECDNLSSIILPNNLSYIGIGAFKSCGSLSSITIPNNVTRIDDEAFEDCINLNSVDFLTNNLTYIGDGAFKNCTSLNTFVVPNSVDSLGKQYGYALYPGTFEGCSSLTKITLGKNLKYISEATFNNCTSLQTLVSLATIPPTFQYVYNTFANTNNVALVVGCDALPNYQNSFDWSYYFANNMTEIIYEVNVSSNDEDNNSNMIQLATLTGGAYDPDPGDSIRLHKKDDTGRESHKVRSVEIAEDGRRWLDIPTGFSMGDSVYLLQTKSMSKRYSHVLPYDLSRYRKQPGDQLLPILDLTSVKDKELSSFFGFDLSGVSEVKLNIEVSGTNKLKTVSLEYKEENGNKVVVSISVGYTQVIKFDLPIIE